MISGSLARLSIAFTIRSVDHSLFIRLLVSKSPETVRRAMNGIPIAVIVHSFDPYYEPEEWVSTRCTPKKMAKTTIYIHGRNESGESVASGVYFYQLRAADYSSLRRMVILK